jgi:enoyl-CoA hydratase
MSSDPVSYAFDGTVATIALDDGKANALSPAMQASVNGALDRAETDAAVVILAGRPGVFSGGFDLRLLGEGGEDAVAMLRGGFELAHRLLSFPRPVVVACTGHAVAMGSFLLLSADYRVGADGPFRIVANEVAIGLTMPHSALAILRWRLVPAYFDRAVLLSETFDPRSAVAAGFLDRVVDPDEVLSVAGETAAAAAKLDARAHGATKQRARAATLTAIEEGLAEFGPVT